jgi:hypothetical protein
MRQKMNPRRTVTHCKYVNTQYSESFANSIVCMLELSLEYSGVYFGDNHASDSSEEHPIFGLARCTHDARVVIVAHFRRPHLSGRIRTAMILAIKAVVPQIAASASIVFASIPKDLYKFAVAS